MAWQPMLQGHHFELHHHIIKNNNNFKNIKKKVEVHSKCAKYINQNK